MIPVRSDLRNVAIIAHVDHGKTTLVDAMLKFTGSFRVRPDEAQEQVLDTNELERERGITILAKNTSVPYHGVTINIVDTPGHADFGSEVERVLAMVDGALLVVDAVEGPMPQTRFVLRKALAQALKPIVVINKLDRPTARPTEALDKVFDLFVSIGATDEQLDFPAIYTSGKQGWASRTPQGGHDMTPLFEAVLHAVPAPRADPGRPLQMLVTMLDYSSYTGRIGIGRITNGAVARGEPVVLIKPSGRTLSAKANRLELFAGLERREAEAARAGDIVAIAGLEGVDVGDTVASVRDPQPLPPLVVDEPTLAMEFMVNNSPFAGLEGRFVTSRHLRERLLQEAQTNVGLRVESLSGEGHFKVSGRGELHLTILIETMRREGYELAVSRPEVLFKQEDGRALEPLELLVVDVPAEFQGAVIECIGRRGGRMLNMELEGLQQVRLEYEIAARNLIGFKSELLTLTRGLGMMHYGFLGYGPRGPDPAGRPNGVMICKERGRSTGYALFNLQERGALLIRPGVEVYEGMIAGLTARGNDLVVNPAKAKAMTNMRSKASDEAILLTPPLEMSLEQTLEFIDETELVEVTPGSLRLRKKILKASLRKRAERDTRDEERP